MPDLPAEAVKDAYAAYQRAWLTRNQDNPLFAEHVVRDVLEAAEPHIDAAERERTVAAIRLLDYAMHLHVHGERAPGGDETWAQWEHNVRAFTQEGNR